MLKAVPKQRIPSTPRLPATAPAKEARPFFVVVPSAAAEDVGDDNWDWMDTGVGVGDRSDCGVICEEADEDSGAFVVMSAESNMNTEFGARFSFSTCGLSDKPVLVNALTPGMKPEADADPWWMKVDAGVSSNMKVTFINVGGAGNVDSPSGCMQNM